VSFRQARSRRLYEEVVAQVLELIAAGQLAPGSRLPSERELEQRIGVSRNVLREAFHVLEERGIILARPGGGRYVRSVATDTSNPAEQVGRLERATILDLLEARELLETQIVALACARITAAEGESLRAAAQKRESWEDNVEFHVALAATTHNFMLPRLVRQQMELLRDVHQRGYYDAPERAAELLAEHQELAEAVIARDIARAQALTREHFAHTRQNLGLDERAEAAPKKGD
jgi:DNA-binding FadR family transcriptional regulator